MCRNKTVKHTTARSSAAGKDEMKVRWNQWRFKRVMVGAMMAMCVHVASAPVRFWFNEEIESA